MRRQQHNITTMHRVVKCVSFGRSGDVVDHGCAPAVFGDRHDLGRAEEGLQLPLEQQSSLNVSQTNRRSDVGDRGTLSTDGRGEVGRRAQRSHHRLLAPESRTTYGSVSVIVSNCMCYCSLAYRNSVSPRRGRQDRRSPRSLRRCSGSRRAPSVTTFGNSLVMCVDCLNNRFVGWDRHAARRSQKRVSQVSQSLLSQDVEKQSSSGRDPAIKNSEPKTSENRTSEQRYGVRVRLVIRNRRLITTNT